MMKLALIGEHLGHSMSPQIHKIYGEITGCPCDYRLLELPPDRVDLLREIMLAEGLSGVNVTIPYKKAVLSLLDEISPAGKEMGAVNTIAYRGKVGLVGDNTDAGGFLDMLEEGHIQVEGRAFAVLGATGGAARAVIWALKSRGGKVIPVSRAGEINYQNLADFSFDCLVNCTPLGMWPQVEGCPVSSEIMGKARAAADLIYNPRETRFLSLARQAGLKTVGGLYMLVGQAVRAQALWRGVEYDPALTKAIYERMCAL